MDDKLLSKLETEVPALNCGAGWVFTESDYWFAHEGGYLFHGRRFKVI